MCIMVKTIQLGTLGGLMAVFKEVFEPLVTSQLVVGPESPFGHLFLGASQDFREKLVVTGMGECRNGQEALRVYNKETDLDHIVCPGRANLGACPPENSLVKEEGLTYCPLDNFWQ